MTGGLIRRSGTRASMRWGPRVELPNVFGRYRILRELGDGGMGTVYLALDTQLDRVVALKVPHDDAANDSDYLERFDREAKTAAKLSYANICQVYDVGEIAGCRYQTMEFIDGKPKVTDFGLVRKIGVRDQRLTKNGMIIGTPAYMPLEQLHGKVDEIGPHSDVYSLGVILYELLTGQNIYEFPKSLSEQILMILQEALIPITQRRLDVPAALAAAIHRGLTREPEDRFLSIREFRRALKPFAGESA
jgi:serine/threonine protein kinase